MTGIKRIATHSGPFHCDEVRVDDISLHLSLKLIQVLACVILKILPEYQNSEIVRTRDPSNLDRQTLLFLKRLLTP